MLSQHKYRYNIILKSIAIAIVVVFLFNDAAFALDASPPVIARRPKADEAISDLAPTSIFRLADREALVNIVSIDRLIQKNLKELNTLSQKGMSPDGIRKHIDKIKEDLLALKKSGKKGLDQLRVEELSVANNIVELPTNNPALGTLRYNIGGTRIRSSLSEDQVLNDDKADKQITVKDLSEINTTIVDEHSLLYYLVKKKQFAGELAEKGLIIINHDWHIDLWPPELAPAGIDTAEKARQYALTELAAEYHNGVNLGAVKFFVPLGCDGSMQTLIWVVPDEEARNGSDFQSAESRINRWNILTPAFYYYKASPDGPVKICSEYDIGLVVDSGAEIIGPARKFTVYVVTEHNLPALIDELTDGWEAADFKKRLVHSIDIDAFSGTEEAGYDAAFNSAQARKDLVGMDEGYFEKFRKNIKDPALHYSDTCKIIALSPGYTPEEVLAKDVVGKIISDLKTFAIPLASPQEKMRLAGYMGAKEPRLGVQPDMRFADGSMAGETGNGDSPAKSGPNSYTIKRIKCNLTKGMHFLPSYNLTSVIEKIFVRTGVAVSLASSESRVFAGYMFGTLQEILEIADKPIDDLTRHERNLIDEIGIRSPASGKISKDELLRMYYVYSSQKLLELEIMPEDLPGSEYDVTAEGDQQPELLAEIAEFIKDYSREEPLLEYQGVSTASYESLEEKYNKRLEEIVAKATARKLAVDFKDAVIERVTTDEKSRQKTIIALGTGFIPDYNGQDKALQYKDLSGLIVNMRQFCEEKGIVFLDRADEQLPEAIKEAKLVKGCENAKVIVIAKEDALSGALKDLQIDPNVFMMGVDGMNLQPDSYIRIMEMLRIAMEVETNKDKYSANNPPPSPNIPIELRKGFWVFIPKAERMKIDALQAVYVVQKSA